VCGKEPYDPEKQFCFNMELNNLCGDKKETYDPTKFECVDGVVQEKITTAMCGEIEYDPKTEFCAKRGATVEGVYKKVTIAPEGKNYSKTWMAKNLNYKTDEGSSCYDDENTATCATYGRLYNWDVATTVCPDGWHLPTKAEWEALIAAVGGEDVAGKKLKAKVGWADCTDLEENLISGNGDDTYGFSALPGGYTSEGESYSKEEAAGFWSFTEYPGYDQKAYNFTLWNDADGIYRSYQDKAEKYSVRCIQDYQE